MRLQSFIIVPLLALTASCNEQFNVELYPQEQFQGEPHIVESDGCEDIPENVIATSSLRANGRCVIIYSELNCQGTSVMLASDLAKIVFIERVNSVGPCPTIDSDDATDYTISSMISSTTIGSADSTTTSATQTTDSTVSAAETLAPTPSPATTTTETPAPVTLPADSTCSSACEYSGRLLPLLRSYNDVVKDHFYTTNAAEHATAAGYTNEGSIGYLGMEGSDSHCTCLRPLYRLYRAEPKYSSISFDHFYTAEEEERVSADAHAGYKFERIEGYCAAEPGCGAQLPLFRFYSADNKDFFYTTSVEEMKIFNATDSSYGFHRIECYLWQYETANQACH